MSTIQPTIRRVSVTGLFGTLNHDVSLRPNERVTIVHGVNGVGKTKLLELTAALARGNYYRLSQVLFSALVVELSDDSELTATRSELRGKAGRTGVLVKISRMVRGRAKAEFEYQNPSETLPPWVHQQPDGSIIDVRSRRLYQNRYYHLVSEREQEMPREKKEHLLIPNLVHLIETQRLLRLNNDEGEIDEEESGESPGLVMTVHEVRSELKGRISQAQNEFVRKTSELDRTFADRVLQTNANEVALGPALEERLEALDKHRQRLEAVGLLDSRQIGPSLPPAAARTLVGERALMIAVHTGDAEAKYQVLDPLAKRLDSFLGGMNNKLAPRKRLQLDRDLSLVGARRDQMIALDQLSSGEQHELVLLYDLSFRIQRGTLVLIDEPELSLHPIWQQQVLADVTAIAEANDFNVLLATHSPYIIGTRSDLCVELKEA